MKKIAFIFLAAACCAAALGDIRKNPLMDSAEPATERDARMAWWREARMGLFVHWGPYAVTGGVWKGERIQGDSVFMQRNGKIPVADYQAMAARFRPDEFVAEEWVKLAKEMGARYIVVTAKHHDGFAIWPSKASKFNIRDCAGFGRDPLKELAAACRREGMRLGFYYSHARDWHHAGGRIAVRGEILAWDEAQKGDFKKYAREVALPQVRELLTEYGDVAEFWWDTPDEMTEEIAAELKELLKLQPRVISNDRLIAQNVYKGDFATAERYLPAGALGRDWEACNTTNNSWGWTAGDETWKPASELARLLLTAAGRGGNFLLNVGPDAQGKIPEGAVAELRKLGAWVRVNAEAIYGTTAGGFRWLENGAVATQREGKLYFAVFDWPASREVLVPIGNVVRRACLLADAGRNLEVASRMGGVVVKLPERAPGEFATIVVLEIEGAVLSVEQGIKAEADGSFDLPVARAELNGRALKRTNGIIEEWPVRGNYSTGWPIWVEGAGKWRVEVNYACEAKDASGNFEVRVGGRKLKAKVEATQSGKFTVLDLGEVTIAKAGTVEVFFQPEIAARKMKLAGIVLKKVEAFK